ncbi:hypothetical protein FR932_13310 [Moritella marina ATCC 15381]|uniref:Flp pilus assembly protein RcpC/CpaB domain-containing protein n=1 Tax=Moritella marina ATCC 15381 TaxID=1202962 RepID=A0A5J6WPA3_MORMI|nr:RcpC/CpaB family pilus assembly protein [Moritella marina]QFI38760.1 hypothetical protein FR932_13310 [Moritella marina ATCC 15381]
MKSKIILSLAIGLIILGLYGIADSLSHIEKDLPNIPLAENIAPVVKIKTWWLKEDVQRGTLVKRSDFDVQYLVQVDANKRGIYTDVNINFTSGAVYRQDQVQGTLFFPDMLVPPQHDAYIDVVLAPGQVPYVLSVPAKSVVGGTVSNNMRVDLVALTLPQYQMSIEVGSELSKKARMIGVTPVMMNIKVIKVIQQTQIISGELEPSSANVDIVLELTRKQVAILTVAKRIAEIEIHKSIGDFSAADLKADAGDVLPDFKSVTEMRGNNMVIK